MNIFIAGMLAPPNIATELIPYLEDNCPALVARLRTSSADQTQLDPSELGCTPLEWLQLQQAGYQQVPGHTFGANMASMIAGAKEGADPVYIAELTSVNIGRDRMSMIHPSLLRVTQAECDELFESVSMLWDGTGLSALPINTRQWRVWLPASASFDSITPAAVSQYNITDWWPQDASLKNWRKLVNEIQMVWHDHPVNVRRAERDEPSINSIWLFGGAIQSSSKGVQPGQVIDTLAVAHASQDWAAWIAGLPEIDKKIQSLPSEISLNLIGDDRMITLPPIPNRWWHKAIKPRQTNWKSWWINQS